MKENNLLTFKQFIEKNTKMGRWPFTVGSLRAIYRRRVEREMEDAFLKIGNRLFVNEKKFYKR